MVGIRTDLTGAASDTFQAAVKQRQLDLPGGKIRSMEDLGGTERTEAEHKYLPKEADDEAKMVAPIPSTPVQVVDAPDSTGKQCPEQASSAAARLKERTAVAQKIYSKKAEQEVKISICDNGMIDIDQEILGAGPDSKYITLPGHLEEYIYENFQRTPFKFIFSWRKRLFEEMHILPLPRMQFSGDCMYNSTVALMECHFKVMFAGRSAGKCRVFNVRLSAAHLKMMVAKHYKSAAGSKVKLKDLLKTCLLMAKRHGVVSEADFAPGCSAKASAVRYKIKSFKKLTDKEKLDIPTRLERAEMVLTSFRVTDTYRHILPHQIYRYVAPEDPPEVHPAHCVVLTSSGLEYKDVEGDPEVFYGYLNSYNGWGVDGSGYIYADSLRESYAIKVAEPSHM